MSRLYFLAVIILCAFPINQSFAKNEKKLSIQWLGHSAFKLTTTSGKNILIDPFIRHNPLTPKEYKDLDKLGKIDLILISHAHGDHLGDGPEIAKKNNSPLYAPAGLRDSLVYLNLIPEKLAPKFNKGSDIVPFNNGVFFAMTHAEHSSELRWKNDAGKMQVHVGGEAAGFVINFENKFRIYHMGDTALFRDMKLIASFYRPDLVMIPIGGNFTMGPKEAAYAVTKLLKPKYVIPMHYGTFPLLKGNVKDFKKFLGRTRTKVIELKPGEKLDI